MSRGEGAPGFPKEVTRGRSGSNSLPAATTSESGDEPGQVAKRAAIALLANPTLP